MGQISINEYCFGCNEPIYDGEIVYWCDPKTGEEVEVGGEPFHDECSIQPSFLKNDKYGQNG